MKHFEKAYVGIAEVTDGAPGQDSLGFMIPSDGNRTTVDSWAKQRSSKSEAHTKEFDNVPIKGFTFGKHVTRYYNSNKKFRIMDPRGFWLEISAENMSDLVCGTNISYGIIQEECVWLRHKTENYLVPSSDHRYTSVSGKKPTSAYTVGDTIKIGQNETPEVYIGKRWSVTVALTTEVNLKTETYGVSVKGFLNPKPFHHYRHMLPMASSGVIDISERRVQTKSLGVILSSGNDLLDPETSDFCTPGVSKLQHYFSTTAAEERVIGPVSRYGSDRDSKTSSAEIFTFDSKEIAQEFLDSLETLIHDRNQMIMEKFNVSTFDRFNQFNKKIDTSDERMKSYWEKERDTRYTAAPTASDNAKKIKSAYEKFKAEHASSYYYAARNPWWYVSSDYHQYSLEEVLDSAETIEIKNA